MYLEGYRQILNVDYSETCIELMTQRYKDDPRFDKNIFVCKLTNVSKCKYDLKVGICDVRDLTTIKDKSFDVVIDKGTLDSSLVKRL
jgi:hypothetical protein